MAYIKKKPKQQQNKHTNKQNPTTDQKFCIKVCLSGHYTAVLILENENLGKAFSE